MKKILTLLTLCSLSSLTIQAAELEQNEMKEKESNFYVAAKAIVTLGDSIDEEEVTLEGDTGIGIGIDLGYKLGYGFSVEVDGTYVSNNVTETQENGDSETFTASYITSSIDIAYKYPITHEVGVVLKTGYEYEIEKINDLDIDNTETGFVFAGAVEYEVSEHGAILAEYEVTTIDGPRGNSVFLGMLYSF
jgi:opacity protein-like surface antigen